MRDPPLHLHRVLEHEEVLLRGRRQSQASRPVVLDDLRRELRDRQNLVVSCTAKCASGALDADRPVVDDAPLALPSVQKAAFSKQTEFSFD